MIDANPSGILSTLLPPPPPTFPWQFSSTHLYSLFMFFKAGVKVTQGLCEILFQM